MREGERDREGGEGVSGGFISQVREEERDREGGGGKKGCQEASYHR